VSVWGGAEAAGSLKVLANGCSGVAWQNPPLFRFARHGLGLNRAALVALTRTWLHHRRLRRGNPELGFTMVVNGHREGPYLAAAVRSAIEAAQAVLHQGIPVELLLVLDRPDATTRSVARRVLGECRFPHRCLRLRVGDLGLARNAAVRQARLPWIAFLDGDDLWAANWLDTVLQAIKGHVAPRHCIFHPRYSFYFQQQEAVLHSPDQAELACPEALLVADNVWTALSCAHRDLLRAHPYQPNRLREGLGFEDWSWNRRVVHAGNHHMALAGTCHFIRRQSGSLCRRTEQADALATP